MFLAEINDTLHQLLPKKGDHATSISGLTLHRYDDLTQPLPCVYSLSLCFVSQGQKHVQLGNEFYTCGAGDIMLATLDLPVISHVSQASRQQPFLAALLQLDLSLLYEVNAELGLSTPHKSASYQSLSIEAANDAILSIFKRLLKLHSEPELQNHLLPLLQKELAIHLLHGSQGTYLRNIMAAGLPSRQIAESVSWLKHHFTESFTIQSLAERANMSPSNFRKYFREITGSSPLQFQKKLRLQEARELMLARNLDASQASSLVGYESNSQFSREYSRMFGTPPQKDIRQLREMA